MLNRLTHVAGRVPGLFPVAICLLGLLIAGCPSKDTTEPNYEPPATSAPQP
ncbi:MAG TPA: hypothetical protein PLI70_03160 [Gemmatimonadales bacterium]|nr:hypothetical protein [Gemmatimonadales bacterium]HRZ09553.1 hypothetical protein [Gemmatimonadales bacterium]